MKRVIFASAILLVASNSYALELSWNEIVKLAGEKNPSLINSKENIEKAKLDYRNSVANFLPQVSATAGMNRSGGDGQDPSSSYSYGLAGRLSLFSGFADATDLKIKKINIQAAETQYSRTLSDVTYSLRRSYINLLYQQETVSLAEKIAERRNTNYRLIKLKYEAGSEDKGSMMKVQADYQQALYELKKTKRDIDTASIELARNIGITPRDTITVHGDIISVKYENNVSFNELVNKTPEYLLAKYNLEKSALGITTARSSFYPGLSASASYSKSGSEFPPDRSGWSTGLSLSLPLFTGGQNTNNLSSANRNKLIAENSFHDTEKQVFLQLKTGMNNLIDSVEFLRISENYMNATEEQTRIINAKYLNGLSSYLEWYSAENDYINSEKNLLNAKKDAELTQAAWKNLLGD